MSQEHCFRRGSQDPISFLNKENVWITPFQISMSLVTNSPPNGSQREAKNSMERECHSLADIVNSTDTPVRKNTEVGLAPSLSKRARQCNARLQPNNLLAKVDKQGTKPHLFFVFQAHEHYQINGPGKAVRGSKEKMVYLRERKALKTIGIVVLG